jgi:hypothetical protein
MHGLRDLDDGKMSKMQREVALEKIRTDKQIKCILISFKAGSIGMFSFPIMEREGSDFVLGFWWDRAQSDGVQ